MQRYDALVEHPYVDHPNMEILFVILIAALMFTPYFDIKRLTLQSMLQLILSFGGGLIISMWISYVLVIHWEKKNNKTIYFDESYGMWKKSYIILEKK